MPKAPNILICDDDPVVHQSLSLYLDAEKLTYADAYNGQEALQMIDKSAFDLMVLDQMMPGLSGMEVCQAVRKKSQLPIIMLTARGEEIDRILGLEMGADDYITKPCEPTELVARVEAVLRRCGKAQGTLAAFDVVLDPAARRVTRSGTPLHLTPREFDLLEVLLRNRGIVLYREVLYERVWGLDAEYDSRTLDLHIQRLRKKLGWKNEIRTVFRVGYVLERGE